MSSSTPERRTEPSTTPRPASETTSSDPTSRFRPFGGSAAPTTVNPVTHDPATRDPEKRDPAARSSAVEWEDPEDTGPERVRHVVDRFDGAAGLLILRLVTAVILAIRGLQILQHLDVTRDQFAQLGLPSPDVLAVVVGAVAFASAFLLIIGALVRVAGIAIAVLAVASLVYVTWRSGDFFTSGQPGFHGELELLVAAVGLTFAGLGGGGWGVDRRFRRR
jgi:uncharacterized membrane protein YphA (DoxX/SURF4 family)